MIEAYGFVEITGVIAATDALDIMCKTSDIKFVTWENRLGGRLCTVIITGSLSAVKMAIEAVRKKAIKEPAAYAIMGRPSKQIIEIIERSAKKHNFK